MSSGRVGWAAVSVTHLTWLQQSQALQYLELDGGGSFVGIHADGHWSHACSPRRRKDWYWASWAAPLRAGQTPLEPHSATALDGGTPEVSHTQQRGGPPMREPPVEHLDLAWPGIGRTAIQQVADVRMVKLL
jgi:hypothetical protein